MRRISREAIWLSEMYPETTHPPLNRGDNTTESNTNSKEWPVNKKRSEMADIQKTAIVTGASQGIGAALVEAFLIRGYSVVANSRNITKANPFPASPNLALVDGDIGDPKTASKIVDAAVSRFGRVDVLINNAGIFIPKPFTEYTTEDLNALVSTTIAGFLYVSQLSVKQMLRQKSGSIVNVSTTLVDQPIAGVPATVQVMAKGSLDAVTRALAIEYAKDGIRVNTVALGVIKTPMHKPETYGFLNGLHPVGRMGEIKEVVDAVLFLTDATFTTGEILHVDGGAHAGKW
jgi:NAD(P)-dependent dehydrogenase (short-subunit alcohol dehydrogenase family)